MASCGALGGPALIDAGADGGGRSPPGLCPNANEAPLPSGVLATTTCVRVGASIQATTGEWPDRTGARYPLVYVKAEATAPEDGTLDHPFRTVESAVNALQGGLGNGTVVLHRGDHVVATTLAISHDVSMLGVGGPNGSTIVPPPTAPAMRINAAGISFTVRGVTFNKPATPHDGAMLVTGDGILALRDVTITNSQQGIDARSGHLDAQDLTIADTRIGIGLGQLGDGSVRSAWIHGGDVGIQSTGGALALSQSMINDVNRGGISFNLASGQTAVTLDHIAVLRAGMIGIWLGGTGLSVNATHLHVTGTRLVSPGTGMGIVVTHHASMRLEDATFTDLERGSASIIRGNEATGVLFDDYASGLVRGTLIESNGQSGVMIQSHANVEEVGDCWLQNNVGSGVTVSTGASIAKLLCDGFRGNRRGQMNFSGGVTMEMANGADIEPTMDPTAGVQGIVDVSQCLFEGHAGYGLLTVSVDLRQSNNTYLENTIGWAAYGSPSQALGVPTDPNAPADAPSQRPGAMDVGSAP